MQSMKHTISTMNKYLDFLSTLKTKSTFACKNEVLLIFGFHVCSLLMLNLLLGFHITWIWTVLPTFQRYSQPQSLGSKWVWWVKVHAYLGLGPTHQSIKGKSWCLILANRDSGQGKVIKGPILQLFPVYHPYWLGWGIHLIMVKLDENAYIYMNTNSPSSLSSWKRRQHVLVVCIHPRMF
jgi:hypothetical protein